MLAAEEAERKAKLPGTIVITTVPPGAQVAIDGMSPKASPVKAENLTPGAHKLKVTLAGHEEVDLDAMVTAGEVTDLGSVALQSSFGSLTIESSPDKLEYSLHPAGDPTGTPVRTGRTPASFDDIPHGDYVVIFKRPGCRDHTEKAAIEKGSSTDVKTAYVDGSLELASDPTGASVNKDGSFLGTTPLVLHDLTPKVAEFVLTLPGYDSTPISCQIPEGNTLKYSAQLLRKDRVFNPTEEKTPPEKVDAPSPALSASQRKAGGDVVLSYVVTRDGLTSDVEVVSTTDDDIARRCTTAVAAWKFRPATAPDDRPVDSRVQESFHFPPFP
jgi:hypothetical protein